MGKGRTNALMIVLTVIYILVVAWIILFKMPPISEIGNMDHLRSINLIPFHYDEETNSHFSEVVENILIFVPFGVYLKILGKHNIFVVACGVVFSLLLEIVQFIFGVGATDITDLMMNTLGAVAGVLIYACLKRIFKDVEKLNKVLSIIALIGTGLFMGLMMVLLLGN